MRLRERKTDRLWRCSGGGAAEVTKPHEAQRDRSDGGRRH
jgi:hypothetical protein